MFLSQSQLSQLVAEKKLCVDPLLNPISECAIELHAGDAVYAYPENIVLDYRNIKGLVAEPVTMLTDDDIVLAPGDFFLIQTKEKVTLSEGYIGWLETKGSIANMGLQAHLCDSHVDPGTNQTLWLQLKNNGNNPIRIYAGMPIVKLYICKMN